MFNNIGEIQNLTSIMQETMNETISLSSSISSTISEISSINLSFPSYYFKNKDINLPSIELPTLPSFTNPIEETFNNIQFINFEFDFCHTSSIDGFSPLNAAMIAISSILENIGTMVSNAFNKAISVFSYIIDSMKNILDWLDTVKTQINTAISNVYNNCKKFLLKAIRDGNKNLQTAWTQVINFIKSKWELVFEKLKSLDTYVFALTDLIEKAKENILHSIEIITKSLGEWGNDLNCLTKKATEVFLS